MSTCVECGASVVNLYTQYSKDNIRLTTCDQCNNFADKYIEHDFVIIFIDMLLHKPQVYRHLLFNRITEQDGVEPHVFRFAILLILFEVCIHNYVSMALIISSFGKMLLILMVIWDYKQLEYSWLVSIIVLASNTEALSA
ncbi:hypothetical protein MUCCIDRAFT_161506 [Mucor lusitanicus CBS 277.49]|uniref:Protein ARV n=1 Tax=Mucor lusitanicus CBS 277.49 TaxID=747725 RepID=A0A168ME40_MUCCL|nr:hypothetical protein MUCCIDRAFT_161506 [Mucor lusitanicus CBS 277.49]